MKRLLWSGGCVLLKNWAGEKLPTLKRHLKMGRKLAGEEKSGAKDKDK